VGHVVSTHDLVRPLPINVVKLIDLEPSRTDTSNLRGIIDGTEKEMRDWSGVAGLIPLNLDSVALVRGDSLNSRGNLVSVHVAGHGIAGNIFDRGVRRRHPDSGLITWGLAIDPELVEVLVGRDGGEEGGSDESFGEHLESEFESDGVRMYIQFSFDSVITDHVTKESKGERVNMDK
jgi:hypothetical protein